MTLSDRRADDLRAIHVNKKHVVGANRAADLYIMKQCRRPIRNRKAVAYSVFQYLRTPRFGKRIVRYRTTELA